MSSGPNRHPHIAPVSVCLTEEVWRLQPYSVCSSAQPSTAQHTGSAQPTAAGNPELPCRSDVKADVDEGSLTTSFGSSLHYLNPESVVAHMGNSSRETGTLGWRDFKKSERVSCGCCTNNQPGDRLELGPWCTHRWADSSSSSSDWSACCSGSSSS